MAKSNLRAVQEARESVETALRAWEETRKNIEAAAERETIALGELHAARLNLIATQKAHKP